MKQVCVYTKNGISYKRRKDIEGLGNHLIILDQFFISFCFWKHVFTCFKGARQSFLCQPAFGKNKDALLHQNVAKKLKKVDFDQHTESSAPNRWSKYATDITKIEAKMHNQICAWTVDNLSPPPLQHPCLFNKWTSVRSRKLIVGF